MYVCVRAHRYIFVDVDFYVEVAFYVELLRCVDVTTINPNIQVLFHEEGSHIKSFVLFKGKKSVCIYSPSVYDSDLETKHL